MCRSLLDNLLTIDFDSVKIDTSTVGGLLQIKKSIEN